MPFRRRRTRFRVTALPTAFVTMYPKRAGSSGERKTAWVMQYAPPTRRPLRTMLRYSSPRVTRCCLDGTIVRVRVKRQLRGELRAALGATCAEDRATRTGAHAKAEAVHLGAAAVVGLERALAHETLRCVELKHPAADDQEIGTGTRGPYKALTLRRNAGPVNVRRVSAQIPSACGISLVGKSASRNFTTCLVRTAWLAWTPSYPQVVDNFLCRPGFRRFACG